MRHSNERMTTHLQAHPSDGRHHFVVSVTGGAEFSSKLFPRIIRRRYMFSKVLARQLSPYEGNWTLHYTKSGVISDVMDNIVMSNPGWQALSEDAGGASTSSPKYLKPWATTSNRSASEFLHRGSTAFQAKKKKKWNNPTAKRQNSTESTRMFRTF